MSEESKKGNDFKVDNDNKEYDKLEDNDDDDDDDGDDGDGIVKTTTMKAKAMKNGGGGEEEEEEEEEEEKDIMSSTTKKGIVDDDDMKKKNDNNDEDDFDTECAILPITDLQRSQAGAQGLLRTPGAVPINGPGVRRDYGTTPVGSSSNDDTTNYDVHDNDDAAAIVPTRTNRTANDEIMDFIDKPYSIVEATLVVDPTTTSNDNETVDNNNNGTTTVTSRGVIQTAIASNVIVIEDPYYNINNNNNNDKDDNDTARNRMMGRKNEENADRRKKGLQQLYILIAFLTVLTIVGAALIVVFALKAGRATDNNDTDNNNSSISNNSNSSNSTGSQQGQQKEGQDGMPDEFNDNNNRFIDTTIHAFLIRTEIDDENTTNCLQRSNTSNLDDDVNANEEEEEEEEDEDENENEDDDAKLSKAVLHVKIYCGKFEKTRNDTDEIMFPTPYEGIECNKTYANRMECTIPLIVYDIITPILFLCKTKDRDHRGISTLDHKLATVETYPSKHIIECTNGTAITVTGGLFQFCGADDDTNNNNNNNNNNRNPEYWKLKSTIKNESCSNNDNDDNGGSSVIVTTNKGLSLCRVVSSTMNVTIIDYTRDRNCINPIVPSTNRPYVVDPNQFLQYFAQLGSFIKSSSINNNIYN